MSENTTHTKYKVSRLNKPVVIARDRCYTCGSYNLYVKRDSSWPSLMCQDCGAFVRDFGD